MAYTFKKEYANHQISINGWKHNVTKANLTDEVARLVIEKHPELAYLFDETKGYKSSLVGGKKTDIVEGNLKGQPQENDNV